MKANDILGQHYQVNNSDTVDELMQQQGYKKLGAGIDASVYAKDAGNVVKILMPQSKNVRTAKFPFLSFYLYCRANPNNPYLPKFVEVADGKPWEDFVINGERFVQINMERLQPLKERSSLRPVLQMMAGNAAHGNSWEENIQRLSLVQGFRTYGIPRATKLAAHWKEMMENPEYKRTFRDIYRTIEELYAVGKRRGYEWDLHADNFLQRGNTPVISDPWYNSVLKEALSI